MALNEKNLGQVAYAGVGISGANGTRIWIYDNEDADTLTEDGFLDDTGVEIGDLVYGVEPDGLGDVQAANTYVAVAGATGRVALAAVGAGYTQPA